MSLKFKQFRRIGVYHLALMFVLASMLFMAVFFGGAKRSVAMVTQPDWITSEPETIEQKRIPEGDEYLEASRSNCQFRTVGFVADSNVPIVEQKKMCVVEGDGFRIAEGYQPWGTKYMGISFGFDSRFYNLSYPGQDSGTGFVLLPGTKKFMFVFNGWQGSNLRIYDNLPKLLSRKVNGRYEIIIDSASPVWEADRLVQGWGISDNGQYVAYGIPPNGSSYAYPYTIVREDVGTGEKLVVGRNAYIFEAYPMGPPQLTISDDGSSIIATGDGTVKFWKIDDGCAHPPDGRYEVVDQCPSRRYVPHIDPWTNQYAMSHGLHVNDDWSELSYYHNINGQSTWEKITIRASNMSPVTGLDYLALGDSYTSGEGDLKNGYVDGTGGDNGCHLSAYSYPYLLREDWGVSEGKMASVACSGAKINPDYVVGMKGYLGQNDYLLDFYASEYEGKRSEAIAEFTPGIVPQLEFVKKYKPLAVTLTGGGNDAGFADVIRYCASPQIGQSNTCSYAGGGKSLDSLRASIYNQYASMTNLISRIRGVSPLTKIYVVGYPQFVAGHGRLGCGLNAAMLNQAEIETIRNMVVEMNDVLWLASKDAGVQFIDIEDSLEGGQICGGGKYMTGLLNAGLSKKNRSAMFHPSSVGHSRMASTIKGKVANFGDDVVAPVDREAKSASEYIASPISTRADMVSGELYKDSKISLSISPMSFGSNTTVTATVFSEPVELGEMVATDDGAVTAEFDIPEAVEAGEHLLMLEGQSYTGEQITLYQFITIGAKEGDIDGDGVPDSEDRCQFVTEWFDEETEVDTCKEPVVDEPDSPPKSGDGTSPGDDNSDNPSDTKPTLIQKVKLSIQTLIIKIKSAISSLFTSITINTKLRLSW